MLTQHQKKKVNEAKEILNRGDRLVIQGSAGTGKTFLIDYLLDCFPLLEKQKVYCSAPTHKAVSVLKGKIRETNQREFITLHSALKLKRHINYKTGTESFVPSNKNGDPLAGVSLLIIDEASMVDSNILLLVERYTKVHNTKVVFLGDLKQLNPVNELTSPIFTSNYPTITLTEIIRQGQGNPIIELSRDLNLIYKKKSKIIGTEGYIYTYSKEKIIEELAKINGTDELKYLAYTNAEVDSINYLVRHKIYGNPNKVEKGETILFNKPYYTDTANFSTNEELKINNLEIKEKEFSYLVKNTPNEKTETGKIKLKIYSLNPLCNDRICINKQGEEEVIKCRADYIYIIHEDSEGEYNELIKSLTNLAKVAEITFVDLFSFKEQFADIKYNHAISIHKSQGSTFKDIIINVQNVDINKKKEEREKLLYTGITRAKNLVILYNV
ncbi:MAG: ATP-dependent DNA helicase [Fusobacteriaceae bacterium]